VITLEGPATATPEVEAILERLAAEDALGQLLRREGRMAALATEGGDVKLDWVDGVERALAAPGALAEVEAEGAATVRQGIRHVIWSGMGGSVQTVYALKRMGYLDGPALSVHPLDSTDPAALNRILGAAGAAGGRDLAEALSRTAMIGVSMGMTSEEPITHLEWFDGLLEEHGVPDPGSHIQVMTLPDSYLDRFARARGSRMAPIQLDGENHTPGRMSAPATRVFLRPVALMLAAAAVTGARSAPVGGGGPGPAGGAGEARPTPGAGEREPTGNGLRAVLQRGQDLYELAHALSGGEREALTRRDPFVRLAAWLSLRADSGRGAPKLLVTLPPGWEGFAPWLEQLVEESLGKGGKGFLIFYGQSPGGRYGPDCAVLRIAVEGHPAPPEGPPGLPALTLRVPAAPLRGVPDALAGLGELAGLFLGFKKTVAAYGYLQDIVFAGQPAVEAYKQYARDLREAGAPVRLHQLSGTGDAGRVRTPEGLTLDYSSLLRLGLVDAPALAAEGDDPVAVLAAILGAARRAGSLRYLDLTWNGEPTPALQGALEGARAGLANTALGVPAKLRTGPSDYHSTEQGETDGPPELVSLRLVAEHHEAVAAGAYDDTFLLAQARGTWQAMEDAGRWIVFLTLPRADAESAGALSRLFEGAAGRLAAGSATGGEPSGGILPRG
jgi:glucose-6-phosphate isomerase